jgi:putative dimethyl sulfoxide reductase chaperone
MNARISATPESGTLAAEDLRALAWLHEAERPPQELVALHRCGFPRTLFVLDSRHAAVLAMAECLTLLENTSPDQLASCADDLAADYAGIYLTHRLRASPCASVWLDPDQLMMQAPAFAVREAYARHGVRVTNWRHQPDDHVVHELRFLALLLERGERREAARFARTHLLPWLPRFTAQVEARAHTRFYACLATLTMACVQACVDALPQVAVLPPIVQAAAHASHPGCGMD